MPVPGPGRITECGLEKRKKKGGQADRVQRPVGGGKKERRKRPNSGLQGSLLGGKGLWEFITGKKKGNKTG